MATYSAQMVDKLLDKLSGDDLFRQQLLSDPEHALSGIGIRLDPGQIPQVRNLPSKEVIAAHRFAIKSKMETAAGAYPFFLSGRV
jgi:putative modified peptide